MNIRRIATTVGVMIAAGVAILRFPTVNMWVIVIPVAIALGAVEFYTRPGKSSKARPIPKSTAVPSRPMRASPSTAATYTNESKPNSARAEAAANASPAHSGRQKVLLDAAEYFGKAVRKFVATERGLHAETAIVSSARMAGTMLFRSFKLPVAASPGTPVFSDQANQEGPKMMKLLLNTLTGLGESVPEDQIGPVLGTVNTKMSQLSLQDTQRKLDPWFIKYAKAASMSDREVAAAAIVATAKLIHECKPVLDVTKGSALAIQGLMEGVKTAPVQIEG